ncbi:hypothetical protein IG631_19419 [Alternaria alternata]|nr:hypothetical protein IG631_19419 [Alternaria alternata]
MVHSRVPRAVTSGNLQTTRVLLRGIGLGPNLHLRGQQWYLHGTLLFHRQVGPALWSGKRSFSHFETARTSKSWVMSATSPSSRRYGMHGNSQLPRLYPFPKALMRFAEMRDEAPS